MPITKTVQTEWYVVRADDFILNISPQGLHGLLCLGLYPDDTLGFSLVPFPVFHFHDSRSSTVTKGQNS